MRKTQGSAEARLITALEEALQHERGELATADVRDVPITARDVKARKAPKVSAAWIARLREKKLGLSQAALASAMNVSRETVSAWEQGKRYPDGAAVRLLQIAEADPEILRGYLAPRPRKGTPAASR